MDEIRKEGRKIYSKLAHGRETVSQPRIYGSSFEIAKRIGISHANSKKIIEKGTEEQNNLLTISKMDVVSFSFLPSFLPHLFMVIQIPLSIRIIPLDDWILLVGTKSIPSTSINLSFDTGHTFEHYLRHHLFFAWDWRKTAATDIINIVQGLWI